MKHVPAIAFFAGAVLVGSAIALLAALFITGYQSVPARHEMKPFNEQMASARNNEELKQACLSIARVYDAQSQLLELQDAEISRLFHTLVWGGAGAGLVLGTLFLWIYASTRKLAT